MALSGSFTGTTNNQYVQPKITWNATQNISENYSTITATLTYSRTNSGYTTSGTWSGSITINGVTTTGSSSGQIYITQNSNTKAMSATVKVPHNSDGSKSVSISCTGTISAAGLQTTTCATTVTLDTIPRQANLTSSPNFTDLENPTVYYSNPAGNSVGSLQACISFTGAKADIAYRNILKTETSYTFDLTDSERNVLRNNTTSGSRTVIFYIKTVLENKTYYSTQTRNFTVAETDDTRPTVTLSVELNNEALPDEFDGLYIQGKSRLDINISAEGKYSASIIGYSAKIGEDTYNSDIFLSNVIRTDGTVEVIGYATDSRRFIGSAKQDIDVISYSKPLVVPIGDQTAICCYRSDGNGRRIGNSTSVWIKAQRSYHSIAGINHCALQWRRKLVTEAWDDAIHLWQDLISATDVTTTEYNALLPDEVFDLRESYSVQIRAIDYIGESDIKNFEVPTQDVALHLGKGGKNVSVGTYCDYSKEYTFYSDWDAYFDKDVYIGEKKISDFIVEEGSEGIWHYRKWNSGIAECWGIYEASGVNAAKNNYNGFYYSDAIVVDFPFSFVENPVVQVNGGSSSHMNFVRTFGHALHRAQFDVVGLANITSTAITVDIHAIGKWK